MNGPHSGLSDLKLVDELLCDIRSLLGIGWDDMPRRSELYREALKRVRAAHSDGMAITLGIANHFERSSDRS